MVTRSKSHVSLREGFSHGNLTPCQLWVLQFNLWHPKTTWLKGRVILWVEAPSGMLPPWQVWRLKALGSRNLMFLISYVIWPRVTLILRVKWRYDVMCLCPKNILLLSSLIIPNIILFLLYLVVNGVNFISWEEIQNECMRNELNEMKPLTVSRHLAMSVGH